MCISVSQGTVRGEHAWAWRAQAFLPSARRSRTPRCRGTVVIKQYNHRRIMAENSLKYMPSDWLLWHSDFTKFHISRGSSPDHAG